MDMKGSEEGDLVIDIECGVNVNGKESRKDGESDEKHKQQNILNRVWSGFNSNEGPGKKNEVCRLGLRCPDSVLVPIVNGELAVVKTNGGEQSACFSEIKIGTEKAKKKKSCKKPPKPPRPPKGPLLDAADQKFVREISELAMLKRARVERMKALKKTKQTKSACSYSNIWAFIITILFCVVIFWQGFGSRSSSNLSFEGSPVSSVENREGLISVQYYTNVSRSRSNGSNSASPDIIAQVSGLDMKDDMSKATR